MGALHYNGHRHVELKVDVHLLKEGTNAALNSSWASDFLEHKGTHLYE